MTEEGRPRLPRRTFSEQEAARILDRLIELDRRDERGLSRTQIDDIARELGIPRRLVDRAIMESSARGVPESERVGVRARSPLREALLLAALGAGAFLPTALLGTSELWGTLSVGMISIGLGLDSRRADAGLRFRIRSLGLWTGFVLGGSTLFSMGPDLTLGLVIGLPVLAGTGILALGRWISSRSSRSAGPGRQDLRRTIRQTMAGLFGAIRGGVKLWKKQFGSPERGRGGSKGSGRLPVSRWRFPRKPLRLVPIQA